MNIAIKYKIVEKIIQSNDENLLNEVKSLLGLFEGDFWAELPSEVKQVINKAKGERDRGGGSIDRMDNFNFVLKSYILKC